MDRLLIDYPNTANCECVPNDDIVEGRPFYFDLPPPITDKGNFTFSYRHAVKMKAKFYVKFLLFHFFHPPSYSLPHDINSHIKQ